MLGIGWFYFLKYRFYSGMTENDVSGKEGSRFADC